MAVIKSLASAKIGDLEVLNNKLYVSVIRGRQEDFNWRDPSWLDRLLEELEELLGGIFGDDSCDPFHRTGNQEIIKNFTIFSTTDGNNWEQVFNHKSGIQRAEGGGKFPLVQLKGKLYTGIVESSYGENSLFEGNASLFRTPLKSNSNFVSEPYNLGEFSSAAISWELEGFEDASIKFQIKTASSSSELESVAFSGDIVDSGSSFPPSQEGDSWIQIKGEITADADSNNIPKLNKISIIRDDVISETRQFGIIEYY